MYPVSPSRTEIRRSRPVSRVLSWTIIHLGPPSPTASSDLPKSPGGQPVSRAAIAPDHSSIWSCSRWGLPCRGMLPSARCALTAPFHPCRALSARRYIFCGTFRGLAPPRRYLAPCPQEPGLSSHPVNRASDCLAGSSRNLSSTLLPEQLGQFIGFAPTHPGNASRQRG